MDELFAGKIGKEERMSVNLLVEKICLEICDGHGGRCQRYPIISESCEDFIHLKKAYFAGRREVLNALNMINKEADNLRDFSKRVCELIEELEAEQWNVVK